MATPAQPARAQPAVARLGRLLASSPRAWTREQLIDATSDHTITAAIRAGIAIHAAPGIYISPEFMAEPRTLIDVASKWASPVGAVGGVAALWVHGLIKTPPTQVTIVAPHTFKRARLPFTAVRRFTIEIPHLQLRDLVTVPPIDAVVQAWPELEPARRIGVTLDALRMGRLDAALVRQRLAAYPRVRGRSGLLKVLAEFGDGATSFLEYRARTRVFADAEFSGFAWQVHLDVRGRRYVLDMFHRAARLAVELDGRAFHGDNKARLRDIERDVHLATVDIATLRLTYDDIMRRPEWCRRTVSLALHARTGRLTSIERRDRAESPPWDGRITDGRITDGRITDGWSA